MTRRTILALLLALPLSLPAGTIAFYIFSFTPAQPQAGQPVTMTVRTNVPIAGLSTLYPVTVNGSTIRVTVEIFPVGPIAADTDYSFAIGAFPAGQYTVEYWERSISGQTPPSFPGSLIRTTSLTVSGVSQPVEVPSLGAAAGVLLGGLIALLAVRRLRRTASPHRAGRVPRD